MDRTGVMLYPLGRDIRKTQRNSNTRVGSKGIPEFLRMESGERRYGDQKQRVQNHGNLKGALELEAEKRQRRKPGSCPESAAQAILRRQEPVQTQTREFH